MVAGGGAGKEAGLGVRETGGEGRLVFGGKGRWRVRREHDRRKGVLAGKKGV